MEHKRISKERLGNSLSPLTGSHPTDTYSLKTIIRIMKRKTNLKEKMEKMRASVGVHLILTMEKVKTLKRKMTKRCHIWRPKLYIHLIMFQQQ